MEENLNRSQSCQVHYSVRFGRRFFTSGWLRSTHDLLGNSQLKPGTTSPLGGRVWRAKRERMSMKRKVKSAKQGLRLSRKRLDELVEEALTDAYGGLEQATGFYTMLENNLRLPFGTQIMGLAVTMESIDITDDDQVVAVCRKGRSRQRISLAELPVPSPPPEGAEWIVAYRYWRTGSIM